MIVDCFDILTSLTQTEEGSIKLVDYGSITALSEVITEQLRGRSVLCFLYNIVFAWNSHCLSLIIHYPYILLRITTILQFFQDNEKKCEQ